jgi:pyridoxine/pyridoxamine 5'-phosphate oxidase
MYEIPTRAIPWTALRNTPEEVSFNETRTARLFDRCSYL